MDLIGIDRLNKETIPLLAATLDRVLKRFVDGVTITIHIKTENQNANTVSGSIDRVNVDSENHRDG
jgi:hypothetical protein